MTATAAAEQVEDAQANVEEPQALEEIVADKGYHSNHTMVALDAVAIRSYMRSLIGADGTGRRRPTRRRGCTGIVAGFAAVVDGG